MNAVFHSLLIGTVTGLMMLIPIVYQAPQTTTLRSLWVKARSMTVAGLILVGGMLYSLPNGFVLDGVHAHQVTGIAGYLVFTLAYLLIHKGLHRRIARSITRLALHRVDRLRARSGGFHGFCLRIESALHEYRLLKARQASQR